MERNALDYMAVISQNGRHLGGKVHPRLEVVVQVPQAEFALHPTLSLSAFVHLPALKTLLET